MEPLPTLCVLLYWSSLIVAYQRSVSCKAFWLAHFLPQRQALSMMPLPTWSSASFKNNCRAFGLLSRVWVLIILRIRVVQWYTQLQRDLSYRSRDWKKSSGNQPTTGSFSFLCKYQRRVCIWSTVSQRNPTIWYPTNSQLCIARESCSSATDPGNDPVLKNMWR